MKLIIGPNALKFYISWINEDEDKIELITKEEFIDKSKVIMIRLFKTDWQLKNVIPKEGFNEKGTRTYIFEKSKERIEREKQLEKTKLFKEYKKDPYDEKRDNQFIASLGIWTKNIFGKYKIFEREDFSNTLHRMHEYIIQLLSCDTPEQYESLKKDIIMKHSFLKRDVERVVKNDG